MLKLKLQSFGHLMWRADSLEKTLMLGKDWRQKEKGVADDEKVRQHHWFNIHESEQTPGDSGQESLARNSMGLQRVRHDLETEQQQHEN